MSVIITFFITSLNSKSKPVIYTTETIIKVGRIANIDIDILCFNSPTIYNILKQIEKKYLISFNIPKGSNKTQINFSGNINFSLLIEPVSDFSSKFYTNLYSTSIISAEANLPLEIANFVNKLLLNEHKKLYIYGVTKLKENINYFKERKAVKNNVFFTISYLLYSYTYESEIITNPVLVKNPHSNKLTVKLAFAFMASLFIEYILAHRRETDQH